MKQILWNTGQICFKLSVPVLFATTWHGVSSNMWCVLRDCTWRGRGNGNTDVFGSVYHSISLHISVFGKLGCHDMLWKSDMGYIGVFDCVNFPIQVKQSRKIMIGSDQRIESGNINCSANRTKTGFFIVNKTNFTWPQQSQIDRQTSRNALVLSRDANTDYGLRQVLSQPFKVQAVLLSGV